MADYFTNCKLGPFREVKQIPRVLARWRVKLAERRPAVRHCKELQ